MDSNQHLNISVSLDYRDSEGMQKFVDSVSNPRSSNYRHFITPDEVGRKFGPLPSTIKQVQTFLTKNGLTIHLVAKNGLAILAEGTVAQVENAFQTQICEFQSYDGYTPRTGRLYSFTSIPSVPVEIQPYIVNVGGLESFSHPKPNLVPLTPTNVRSVYNVSPLYSSGSQGQGRTIAISSWDGYRLSNVAHEYSTYGLPTPAGGVGSNITVKTVSGGCGAGAEQGEADLDIQSILGVAPLCNLIIYDGGNSDLIGVLTQETNDNAADIISESYGWTLASSTMTAAHNLHLSMTAQGITYMAASGDSGTTVTYYYPDVDPEVLSVGGTEAFANSDGTRQAEYGWAGSGGGWKNTSESFNTLPSYQVGTGVPTSINHRLYPDLAANADPNTGYEVFMNGGFTVIGGTSGASPTFAACLGDAEQQLITNGTLTTDSHGKQRLGRIQDVIYALNGDATVFYDITTGSSNGSLPDGSTSNAHAGWDFVTGWGAMDFSGFVTKMSGAGLSQFSLSASTIEGSTGTVTATLSMLTPAPTGGTAVTISGGDSSVSYPTTVTIPAGSRSATFAITSSAVSANHSETFTATIGSKSKTASLTVTPASIVSVVFTPGFATSATTFSGVVTLSSAAPTGGDVVTLTGGDSSVSHPGSVTVAGGATTATFSMTASAVAGSVTETITGTLAGSTQSGSVTLTGLKVSGFTLSAPSVLGGGSVTGTITLSGTAGSSGIPVTISGGDSSVTYSTTVTVPAHASTATFKITTSAVASATSESITATLSTASKSANFTITSPVIASVAFSPTAVFGGVSSVATVKLTGPACSAGVTIALSGGDSSISIPSTVSVAAGATTASFTATTSIVSKATTESLKATLGSTPTPFSLVLNPEGVVAGLSFSPSSIVGGKTSTGTITLTSGAGPTGVTVTLSGGDSNISYPATVTIPTGASSKTFTVTSNAVATSATEILTATFGPTSAKGNLTVSAPTVSSISLAPSTVVGGTSVTGTVTISGAAPTGGSTVSLSGGNSATSYPSTVSIAAGATSAKFTITTSAVSLTANVSITAKLGSSSASGSLTISAPTLTNFAFSSTLVSGGGTTTGTVTISSAAGPSGAVIKLGGSTAALSFPTSVTVAAGATTATFTATAATVTKTTAVTVTATLGATQKAATVSVH